MRIKKIISIFLTAALILSALPVLGSAEETEIFKVGVEALPATSTVSSTPLIFNQGQEITVVISASQNSGITDTRLVIEYDETILEPVEGKYEAKDLFLKGESLVKTTYKNKYVDYGECLVFISNGNAKPSTATGAFAEVTFKVKAACADASTIYVQELNPGKESYNGAKNVPVTCDPLAYAAHKLDVAAGVVTAPTCTEEGYTTYACSACEKDVVGNIVAANGHSPAELPVVENFVDSDCTEAGSYDDVVYCTVCNTELSREKKVINAKGHSPAAPVEENRVEAGCVDKGSYDTVVYCDREGCGAELSRVHEVILPEGHKPAAAVIENRVESTCIKKGSYDSVIYCSVCDEELSRVTVDLPLADHTRGEVVVENRVESTCIKAGSYDNVVYCALEGCKKELSRETVALPLAEHTPGEAVEENRVESTCTKEGSYDIVVYCALEGCKKELSRETKKIEMKPHNLEHHAAQEATHTQIGWAEYDTCKDCDYTTYVEIPMVPYMTGDVTGDDEITDADAIYLLYATFNPDKYPLNQEADYNGDGEVTDADAVYLLYAIFNPDKYPLA